MTAEICHQRTTCPVKSDEQKSKTRVLSQLRTQFVNFDFFSVPSASAATTEGTELEKIIVLPLLCHGTEKQRNWDEHLSRAKIVGVLGILARNTSGTVAPPVNCCDLIFAVFQLWRFNSPVHHLPGEVLLSLQSLCTTT